ncbi:MAG: hypothetical protein K2L96_08455 [Muribaculaceae bacterium]|nr:hypothetical protein [Muribaculaceae bacterium]
MSIIAFSFATDRLIEFDSVINQACDAIKSDIVVRDLRHAGPGSEGTPADEEFPGADLFPQYDDEDPEGEPREGSDLVVCARNIGLRGVFLHARAASVGVGLVTPASPGDYILATFLGLKLGELTGNPPEFDRQICDPDYIPQPSSGEELFSPAWISQCMLMDFARLFVTALRGSFPIVLKCFNFPAVIGPRLLSSIRLYPLKAPSESTAAAYRRLTSYLASVQWKYEDAQPTATGRCLVRHVDDPAEREAMENNDFTEEDARRILAELGNGDRTAFFSMSAIPMGMPEGSPVPAPQLLLYADYLSFVDIEARDQLAVVPFTCIRSLIEGVPGTFIDEYQYFAEEPVDDARAAEMLSGASRYISSSPFTRPVYPGMGAPAGANTFVFFWRPGVNGPSIREFRSYIPKFQLLTPEWEITEHTSARIGDRFFMICTSSRMPRGVVMSGILSSNPFPSADGRGWLVELKPNFIMDPRHPSLITCDLLADAIPGFDWTGGPNGRLLPADDAATLEELWAPELDHAVTTVGASYATEKGLNAIWPEQCTY